MNEMNPRDVLEIGPRLTRAISAGFVATVLMTLLMYWAAPLALGQPMDVAAMLATATGGSWLFGMTFHFINGTLIFPAIYARGLYPWLSGSPAMRGATFGTVLWLLSQTIVMPMMGAGFFSSAAGGFTAVVVSLLAHWVYGGLLGGLAGERDVGNLGVELAERRSPSRSEPSEVRS